MAPNERLAALAAAGVSIWLDDLSRERLTTGNLQELITDKSVVGVTTNPTIFAAALAKGQAYDAQVRELAARDASVDDVVREVTVADVQQACDVFSGTWEHTGGVDGRVSLEVSPLLARDTEATLAEALDLWKAVDRPNLLVKIPATQEGLSAITRALAEGVSVNVTLIFSVERYRDVMNAYMEGLEQASARVASVSRASSGLTSSDTRPSTPPVCSQVPENTSQARWTSATVTSRTVSSTEAPRALRSRTWLS